VDWVVWQRRRCVGFWEHEVIGGSDCCEHSADIRVVQDLEGPTQNEISLLNLRSSLRAKAQRAADVVARRSFKTCRRS